jgi:hypothetical protein
MRSAKKRDPMEYIHGWATQGGRYNHQKKKDYGNYMRSGLAVYRGLLTERKKEKKKSLDESIN